MAKNAKKQNKKPAADVSETVLPQNILPIGERVEENKNIYISQTVYKQIRKFTKNKTRDESGGILVGTVLEKLGKTNIIISDFIEAKYCEATPTTLTFTHETWTYIHKEVEKKHKRKKILGWIHTHPDFGIFLSEYDKFIHQNFFSEENQIAYVVDPLQKIEGFYFWINGSIERCKGFYIYDKVGIPITVNAGKDAPVHKREEGTVFSVKNLLIAILAVAVVVLTFSSISINKRLERLEREKEKLEQQQIIINEKNNWLQMNMLSLVELLKEAGILPDVQEPEDVPSSGPTATEQGIQDPTEGNPNDTTEGGNSINE